MHPNYIDLCIKIGSNFQDEITFDYYLKYPFPNLSLFSFSSYFLKCPQRTINFVANDEERLEMVELLCKASAKLRSKKTQKLIIVTKWNAQIFPSISKWIFLTIYIVHLRLYPYYITLIRKRWCIWFIFIVMFMLLTLHNYVTT